MDHKNIFSDSFHMLIKKFIAIQNRAKQLGIFVYDRELLICHTCGLAEDENLF